MRLAVVLTIVFSSSLAAAQAPGQTLSFDPETPPSAAEPQTVTVSYRSDVLLADGASLGLIVLGPVSGNAELTAYGVTGYFLAAPIVHLAHGRGTQAVQSLALRVGLPFFGGFLGYKLGPNDVICESSGGLEGAPSASGGGCGDQGSFVGMGLGILAGGVTAMVLDAKYLTRYEKRVSPSWSASILPSRGGLSLGVSGAF
jgi:hypothetical protein